MDHNVPHTDKVNTELSQGIHVELKRVPQPKARKALASIKEEPSVPKRRGGADAPTVAPSTRPSKPPKPLRRKLRPAARNDVVCEASSTARDRHHKPRIPVDAHPSAVVIQPWGSHDAAPPIDFYAIKERAQLIDEDLYGSPFKKGAFGSTEEKPRNVVPVARRAAISVNAASKGATTTAVKPRKVRPSGLPVKGVPIPERKFESDIYHVLASPLPPSVQDSDVLSPLKRVMTACMNGANGTNVDPVLDLLAAADLEGFPFTPPVRSSISPWKTAAKVFLLTGTSALLRLGVALHPFEPDRDILTVEVPEPLIVGPEKTTTAYRRLTQASMNALGKRFVPSSYAMEVVAFTQQLDAAIASGESQRRDERLHRVVKLKDEIELQIYLLEVLANWTLYRVDELGYLHLPRQGHRAARCLLKMLFEGVSSFFNREILTRSFWSSSAKTSLRRAQLCLQEQARVPASMSLSLLEDHTALKIIQELYQGNIHLASTATASGGTRDVRLPGAEDFTADHLFFIHYSLGFCNSDLRDEELEDQARLVNIPLRGSLMFHEVYGCRPTSKMGPLDKCTAWVAAAKQSAPTRS
ncbi:hypothetical protein HPB52_017686 [Rhipicephalus sanguineus]|uniref:Uncharacterized protein n=1 Tax=Rhipicephalus sanguineus TaxID=34632 RepID=A0A9D4TB68_RHISA|nr:hypothetical protein HPB52_017686 [Rhipicephalus sanguineus]